ncbi:MAG: hypothetical protein M1822_007391 [Bathelium mastoideum]|nr:MAG: hypothetical protein M1822_007391 [Bathelium mastoideum]
MTCVAKGILVPHPKDISHVSIAGAKWILVIEKEATFQAILSSGLGESLLCDGIIVTAKGYPDIATRSFLRALTTPSSWNMFGSSNTFALVDYDPDGLGILSTYKYGSRALAHENTDLATGCIRWLGLNSSQVVQNQQVSHDQQRLITLSKRDRRRANQMLGDEVFREFGGESGWRRELQVMLILNLKAEIQICDSNVDGLSTWLQTQLQ